MLIKILGLLLFIAGIGLALFFPYSEEKDSYGDAVIETKPKPVMLLVALLGIIMLSVTIIPANSVGIKYSKISGVQEKTLGEGIHLTIPFVHTVTNIDTTIQERVLEDINIQTKDGERLTFHMNVKYSVDQDQAFMIYKRYKTLDNLKENIIRNDTENAISAVITQYEAFYVLNEGRPTVQAEAEAFLKESLAAEGVDLRNLTIRTVYADEEYMVRQNARKEAENAVKVAENARLEASIKAQGEQEAAIIKAETMVLEAQAEAEANSLKQKELTPEILMLEYITNWKGDRPLVVGEDNMIDISSLLGE